jgi:hypothetical protein
LQRLNGPAALSEVEKGSFLCSFRKRIFALVMSLSSVIEVCWLLTTHYKERLLAHSFDYIYVHLALSRKALYLRPNNMKKA